MRPRAIPSGGTHNVLTSLYLIITLASFASAITRNGQNAARIPMSSLKTLYFKDGTMTYARRGKKLPQLQCIGNSKHLCDTYGPDIIMCKSAGDGAWRCEADLHPSVRLGSVEVSCEGWDHPDDEYVLRGSCLLEYNILPAYVDGNSSYLGNSSQSSIGSTFFFVAFFAVVGYIVYSFFRSLGISTPRAGAQPRTGGGWGNFGGWGPGGGGGGGHDNPPPPYQPYPKPSDGGSSGWRPGFWTGLGMGGLAAQAARSMFDSSPRQQQQANWGAPRRRTFLDDDDDGPVFRQRAGPSRAGPSETRRSMGFGGTRNR